jgi:putative heme iron utilization protein
MTGADDGARARSAGPEGGPHDARQRLNDHHADDLLAIARVYAGQTDATAARAEGCDPAGVDLAIETPRGPVRTRVEFAAAGDPNRPARQSFRSLARAARDGTEERTR